VADSSTARPVAAVVPETKPDVKPSTPLEFDLDISSSGELSSTDAEGPLVIDPGRASNWSDVEPDDDPNLTVVAAELSGQPRMLSPPIYMAPDRPIIVEEDELPAPPESVTESVAEFTDVATPIELTAPALPATTDPTV